MSLVVADTTPVSCMVRIGRADLLATLFPDLRIPNAVAEELDHGAAVLGDWRGVLLPNARIEVVERSALLSMLEEELDAGEAAALALAVSRRADLVLVDETRGRAVANRLGLTVLGTIGIVALAKRRGLIPAARPIIGQVRARGGLWLTDELVATVLRVPESVQQAPGT
jgi:predicted nucleic acid-binding protein